MVHVARTNNTINTKSCRKDSGCDLIEPILEKLVSVDVKTRGSKLVAMVSNWSHAPCQREPARSMML